MTTEMQKSEVMRQIQEELMQFMNEKNYASQKANAASAGGMIDKFEMKISQFDIAEAFNKVYGGPSTMEESSTARSAGGNNDLEDIKYKLMKVFGGQELPKIDLREIKQKSTIMQENKYFHKFMVKHERQLDNSIEKINRSMEKLLHEEHSKGSPQKHLDMGKITSHDPDEYRESMLKFIAEKNLFRHLNHGLLE